MAKKDEVPTVSTGWQAAVNETLAEKLEGRLLAIIPGETVMKPGEDGKDYPNTLCTVFDITNDEPVFLDAHAPFGWQVVRQQLARATAENPWIVGKLKKSGRAFILESPKVNEVQAISKRIESAAGMLALIDLGAVEEEPF